jgi:phosphatidylethanolamine/phosphatidyl-N-methylethanolamine N-methyltransferase
MTQLTRAETANIELPGDHRPSAANPAMFFGRWLANPLQLGSVIPSSHALCDRIVRRTRCADN